MFGEVRKLLIEAEIYSNDSHTRSRIIGILNRAGYKLILKHRFHTPICLRGICDYNGRPKAKVKVFTESDRVFSLTKDFIYWSFEDTRRKTGFEVDYVTEHVKVDPPGIKKGQGEE